MAVYTLSDGRTITLRQQYLSDKVRIVDLAEALPEDPTPLQQLRAIADAIRPAVEGTSWDGDILDMTDADLLQLLAEWSRRTEEAAVPPVSGTSGETSLPRPDFAESQSS